MRAVSRALREQIDFAAVRRRTAGSSFARAFFVMAEGLEIAPAEAFGAAR